jgi:hypothetical protein
MFTAKSCETSIIQNYENNTTIDLLMFLNRGKAGVFVVYIFPVTELLIFLVLGLFNQIF